MLAARICFAQAQGEAQPGNAGTGVGEVPDAGPATTTVTPRGEEVGPATPLGPERARSLLVSLGDVSAGERESARAVLLSLRRSDLPVLARAAGEAGAMNSEQLRVLHEAVVHVYLAEEPYDALVLAGTPAGGAVAGVGPVGGAGRPGLAGGRGGVVVVGPGGVVVQPGGGFVVQQGNVVVPGASSGNGGFLGLSLSRQVRVRMDRPGDGSRPVRGSDAEPPDNIPGNLPGAPEPGAAGPVGIVVTDPWPGFPSYRYLEEGDIIIGVENVRPLRSIDEFRTLVASRKPGERVRLRLLRRGVEREVEARLAARPAKLMEAAVAGGMSRESFISVRLKAAEEYWIREFAAVLAVSGGPATLPGE